MHFSRSFVRFLRKCRSCKNLSSLVTYHTLLFLNSVSLHFILIFLILLLRAVIRWPIVWRKASPLTTTKCLEAWKWLD
jgi:hypothetical protein